MSMTKQHLYELAAWLVLASVLIQLSHQEPAYRYQPPTFGPAAEAQAWQEYLQECERR